MAGTNNFFENFDPARMMGSFRMPGMDVDTLANSQRKNLEAMTTANRTAFEGMQAVMRRQMEMFRQGMEDMTNMGKTMNGGNPQETMAAQAEAMKDAYQRSVSNARELSDMVTRSGNEAFEVLNKRFTEALDEASQSMKKGAESEGKGKQQ